MSNSIELDINVYPTINIAYVFRKRLKERDGRREWCREGVRDGEAGREGVRDGGGTKGVDIGGREEGEMEGEGGREGVEREEGVKEIGSEGRTNGGR